jgi:hypothetical protein
LREAVRLAPSRVESYEAIAELYGALGSRAESIREITAMLAEGSKSVSTRDQVLGVLSLLSRECKVANRTAQAAVADDLAAWLVRGGTVNLRPLSATAPSAACLPPSVLAGLVMSDAHTALLLVASAMAETTLKMLRTDPAALGLSARDRLSARAPHPLRALADRIARAFGDPKFDLYPDASTVQSVRLLPGEPAAIVLPRGFGDLGETEQAAGLGRALAYVALDVPWLDELPPDDVDGLLFGALRAGSESWGLGQLAKGADASADVWRPRIAKAASRKVKRSLEELAPRVPAQPDTAKFRSAVRAAALRAAYVLTGDLTATLAHVMKSDRELAKTPADALASKVFEHPVTRDVAVFALSDASLSLRRAAGTV